MSNLLVAPIEDNAVKQKVEKRPKPKTGWLEDLITQQAKKSLKMPTTPTDRVAAKDKKPKPGMSKHAMVKLLEEEESREAKIDHQKRMGDRHEQVKGCSMMGGRLRHG